MTHRRRTDADDENHEGERDLVHGLTPAQVEKLFLMVEERVTEHRSAASTKRLVRGGALIAIITALCTAAATTAATMGVRTVGPPQDIAEVRNEVKLGLQGANNRIDTLDRKVSTIITDRLTDGKRTDAIEAKVEFGNYLLCVLVKRSDGTLVPKGC